MTYPTGVNPTASSWHTRPFFHGSTSSPSFSIATSRLSSPAPASSSSLLLAYAALTTVSRTRASSSSSSPRSNGFLPKVAKSRLSSSRPSRNCGSFTPSFSFFALDAVQVPHYLDYATTTTTSTIVIGSSSDEEFSSFNNNNNNIINNSNKINNEYEMGIQNWLSQTNTETSNMKSNLNSILLLSSANNNANTQSSSLTLSQQAQSRAPTNQEVLLLQNAFATFYSSDPSIRNIPQAVELLGQCIDIWETTHQGGDEIAGLYRVRGDGFMEMRQPKEAEQDYTKAIQYLDGPDGDKADPGERPASRLGRARSVRAMGMSASPSLALQASNDYETYLNSISNLDDDMDVDADDESSSKSATTKSSSTTTTNNNKPAFIPSDVLLDGIQRNPYAAWEWGMVQRVAANYNQAAEIHNLASNAFEEIGDKPRAVICRLDLGLDLAAGLKDDTGGGDVAKVSEILETAIKSTVDVSGRDVELLQRVVAKEGEARIALSGVLWNSKEKAKAESMYGTACSRLDELNADYQSREEDRIKKGRMPPLRVQTFGFSIDDMVGAEEASCSRFKNDKFIEEKLVWPASLQMKVNKFLTLGR